MTPNTDTHWPVRVWPPIELPRLRVAIREAVPGKNDDLRFRATKRRATGSVWLASGEGLTYAGWHYAPPPAGLISGALYEVDLESLESIARFVSTYGEPLSPGDEPTFAMREVDAEVYRRTIRRLRDLVSLWTANLEDGEGEALLEFDDLLADWESDWPKPADRFAAVNDFGAYLSAGLTEYAPRVGVGAVFEDVVSLYAAICAQIFNDVGDESRSWRRCQSPSCNRPFRRKWQTDSAKYCKKACAQREASRALRARKRLAKGGDEQ